MPIEQVMQLVNDALANAAQQPELPDENEGYQHEQQEAMPQMQEQMMPEQEMEGQQMPMDIGGGGDMSGVQLPDLQQDSEMM